jgi:trans-aconitate 2-methyltransferase
MNWNPEDYARHSTAQLGWARELMARLALSGKETVLDVGCGDGKITAEFARAVSHGNLLGVDRSAEFIAHARQHHTPAEFPNLRFEVMDARRLAADLQFDVVFSNATLQWVDDHPAVLAGCSRLLRAGGRLLISCGGAGNAADFIAALHELLSWSPWKTFFNGLAMPYHFHAPEDYHGWLAASGLRMTRAELVQKDMTHQSPAELAGWIRTTWIPYTERVPAHLREVFIREMVAHYLQRYPVDPQGKTHVRMVRLEVEAIKP